MFGYEIDGYFTKHPSEVRDFTDLYRLVKARMREIAPEIEVISAEQIDEAYDRVVASNVRYRFVIDTETL